MKQLSEDGGEFNHIDGFLAILGRKTILGGLVALGESATKVSRHDWKGMDEGARLPDGTVVFCGQISPI